MRKESDRLSSVLALTLLVFVALACSGMGNETDEANKLVKSAQEDLAEVNKIADDNDDKSSEISRAENADNADEVKRLLKKAIEAIDKGTGFGKSAIEKLDKASKLKLDPAYKEYLELKTKAFQRQLEAFTALREAAVVERDNYGVGGSDEADAKKEYRRKKDEYEKLLAESKDLHKKADEIARKNPDKIKTS
jgi:hypothetical protein